MIRWLRGIYREWKLNRHCRAWLAAFRQDVQMLYRMGFTTDEIVAGLSVFLLRHNDGSRPEIQRLLRNLPRLVRSHHPTNPTYFESIP